MAYGEELKALREKRGISQRELATALEVSPALIAHYELGAKVPNVSLAERIAKYFGVTIDSMVRGNGK